MLVRVRRYIAGGRNAGVDLVLDLWWLVVQEGC